MRKANKDGASGARGAANAHSGINEAVLGRGRGAEGQTSGPSCTTPEGFSGYCLRLFGGRKSGDDPTLRPRAARV
jgi:hypothetical protein